MTSMPDPEPVTEAQLLDLAKRYRDYLEMQRDLAGPITYTNRTARRARGRAPRNQSETVKKTTKKSKGDKK